MRSTKRIIITVILLVAIVAVNAFSGVLLFRFFTSGDEDGEQDTVFPAPDKIYVYNGDAIVETVSKNDYDYIVTDINTRSNYLEYFSDIQSLETKTEMYIEYKYSELEYVTYDLQMERTTVKASSIRFILTGDDHGKIVIVTDNGEIILEKLSPSPNLIEKIKGLTS